MLEKGRPRCVEAERIEVLRTRFQEILAEGPNRSSFFLPGRAAVSASRIRGVGPGRVKGLSRMP